MAIVTVIYKQPKDTAAFEKYYADTHLPLVSASQAEIGFIKADLTKFESNLDGSAPTLYRQAELYFKSMADLKKGIATPGFKKVADDLAKLRRRRAGRHDRDRNQVARARRRPRLPARAGTPGS